jgi:heterotetrameric sarcosine oxidase gamma subunit
VAEPIILDGPGWRLGESPGAGIATIMARRGHGETLAASVRETFGIELPAGPGRTESRDIVILGTGPGAWIALCPDEATAATIAPRLAESAAVTDQTGGYRLFRLTGPAARRLLQAGVSIDLDPPAFAAGSVAVTNIAQVNAVLSQVDDAPGYDILIFRSYGASFRHWIEAAGTALANPAARS